MRQGGQGWWLDLPAAMSLANVLLTRGALDDAAQLLDAQAARAPLPPHGEVARAAIALRRGQVKEAGQRLDAVLATQPQHILARLLQARVCDVQDQSAVAQAHVAAAHEAAPQSAEVQARWAALRARHAGEAAYEAGDAAGALAQFVAALGHDPEDPVAHNGVGVAAAALGQWRQAHRAFARALQCAPHYAPARENLASLGQQDNA